ncbi:MAG: hypothetical protein R3B93_02370 [Bacteroidia bacterium]
METINKFFPIALFFLICSCQQEQKEGQNFLKYFDDFSEDNLKIEVEEYTQERMFSPEECLPLSFLPLFDSIIPQTQSESTGAKPVGKVKITPENYFLVVVQQDDYGPIYYALNYHEKEHKIINSEKIAVIWGDAGDSQVIYSEINIKDNPLIIRKFIETCHADLEVEEDEIIITNEECSDSVSVVKWEIQ